MGNIVFYREWLSLPKHHFRILAMLADRGDFRGNLADMCRYLGIDPKQQKNREHLRQSIEYLTSNGYITSEQTGRTYHLTAIPKEHPIGMKQEWMHQLKNRTNTAPSVAWEQVLKVYLWIYEHSQDEYVTNRQIEAALGISTNVIVSAKNVLEQEYEAITRSKVSEKLDDDTVRTLGQRLSAVAWWKE